jgi:3-deoxy-D-manno-octulosonic-acid transferase
MLAHAYAYGQIAYIGGGFGSGIHNTLEPAAHGVCVVFGPRHGKFIEAEALMTAGGAWSVGRPEDFAGVMAQCLQSDTRQHAGQAAARCLEGMAGATEKIMVGLKL